MAIANSISFAILVLCGAVLVVQSAPVHLVGFDYTNTKERLAHAPVQNMDTGATHYLDHEGRLELDFPVYSNVTFFVPENGRYHAMQTATVTVPPEGLATEPTEIALQVPSKIVYDVFSSLSTGKKDPSKCQVVVTVCNVNVSWDWGSPEGLLNSTAQLSPASESRIFYFGTWGKLSNATNPLPNKLNHSSWDGGVLFENVPVSNETEYVVTAQHPSGGYTFSETRFRCETPGRFINAAPNQGPRASFSKQRLQEQEGLPGWRGRI